MNLHLTHLSFVVRRHLIFKLIVVFSVSFAMIHSAKAQVFGFPSGKSLSLTIWGAGLATKSNEGRAWDAQSPPDSLVRVYLAGRLVGESGTQRDKNQPLWALTVGPFLEYQFTEGGITVKVFEQDVFTEELIEELQVPLPTNDKVNRVDRLDGANVKPLIYQWVDSSTQVSPKAERPIRERRFSLGDEAPRLPKREKRGEISALREGSKSGAMKPSLPQGGGDEVERARLRSARRASAAAHLYRAYLKAQFSGDQLQEHSILLKLVYRYGQTRHGRKARRLLLLDGR